MRNKLRIISFALASSILMLNGIGGVKANEVAAVFNVNSTTDEVDNNIGNGICNTASNKCTLRAAILEANASSTQSTINLPSGNYNLTINGTDDGSLVGDLDIASDVIITGASPMSTIIDAKSIDRVFDAQFDSKLELRNLTAKGGKVIREDSLTKDGGSGIRVSSGAYLALENVVVRDNMLTVLSETTDNAVINGYGAGIFVDSYGSARINNSAIHNNSGYGNGSRGGGIALLGNQDSQITNSTITNNSNVYEGGGIYKDPYSGDLTILNTTISGNSLNSDQGYPSGSGVSLSGSSNTRIKFSTIANNKSYYGNGSGISMNGFTTFYSSIIANNTKADGTQQNCFTIDGEPVGINSEGYNIFSDNTCTRSNLKGDMYNVDVRFAPLAENGAPMDWVHVLLDGSPAIDAASNVNCPSTDQLGHQRPVNGRCDIGAYESNFASSYSPLYRFWSFQKQGHFYTANAEEKANLISNDPSWAYETVAYQIVKTNELGSCAGTGKSSVYRFWNASVQHHFYTINVEEKEDLIANNKAWAYEGVGFCTDTIQVEGALPVYRFYSATKGAHFYTINENEKNSLIANDPSWAYENIAYYARP